MFACVVRSEEVTRVEESEVDLAVVIEVLCHNTRWISADRITNRTRELNRSGRALVDEDRNSAVSQIRNCDVWFAISFAISTEVSHHQSVWICSNGDVNGRLKGPIAVPFQDRYIIIEDVRHNDVLLAVAC